MTLPPVFKFMWFYDYRSSNPSSVSRRTRRTGTPSFPDSSTEDSATTASAYLVLLVVSVAYGVAATLPILWEPCAGEGSTGDRAVKFVVWG